MRQVFNPATLRAPGGAYSHAVRRGNLVFAAGQVGLKLDGTIAGDDVASQTRQTLRNLEAALAAAGATPADVCSVTAWLVDVGRDFAAYDAAYRETFPTDPPARATVEARLARSDLLVEISAIAVVE